MIFQLGTKKLNSHLLAVLRVCPQVLRQMVRPHELLGALRALKSFLACMGSTVTLKLVRSSESLAAENPITDKRALAGVPTEMGS